MKHLVKVLAVVNESPVIKHVFIEKPEGYIYSPGQATEMFIDNNKSLYPHKPFYFTSSCSSPNIEFYLDSSADEFNTIAPGLKVTIGDVEGSFQYKGPGYFIAEGAGLAPFVPVLRELAEQQNLGSNKLVLINHCFSDIVLEREIRKMFGKNCVFNLTDEERDGFEHFSDLEILLDNSIDDYSKYFYLSGKSENVSKMRKFLIKKGVEERKIIFENKE